MTTKIRIVTGFFVLLCLLGLMAFFGYRSLQTASDNFDAYRRMARVNVWASDLKSSIYETVYYTGVYLNEKTPEAAKEAVARLDGGIKIADDILGRSQREETTASVTRAKGTMGAMREDLAALQTSMEKMLALSRDMQPLLAQGTTVLQQMAEAGKAADNTGALYRQTAIWSSMASVRANLLLFSDSMAPEAGQRLTAAIGRGLKAIDDFGNAIVTETGRRDHAALFEILDSFSKHTPPMLEAGAEAHALVGALADKGRDVLQLVHELNASADQAMRENGEATRVGNEAAQARMLITSLVGMVLGIVFAAFTVLALVRTLSAMSRFAEDIAKGNFDSRIAIKEKGEIGAMFQSMRNIPEIFSGVIAHCDSIANVISSGLFRERLEPEQFNGGFRRLAESINAIADSYTRTIDTLPVGIAALDTKMKTQFTNQAGFTMLGQDVVKAFNGKMPLIEACIRDNRITSGETSLTSPEGAAVEAAATSMPLRDLQGKVVGGLGVFTDITEIKEKQRIMLQVATEAATISDRVAAASEELAAQVEEVSRGAEVQRARVESTASAMMQMNSTVIEVARSAGQASDQSERTRENAYNGAGLVNKVVAAINEVNTVATRLQQNMQSLGDQADSIGSVMNVISDIADQTNLLALNAAIEAARAGEAGRGFAVVADEVRKLAEKTMGATKEVGENISAIQNSAQTNIQEVEVVSKSVGAATNLANDSGEALQEIVELASATSSVVSSIAAAAEEQSAASEEITQAVDEINRLVSETTEGMIQSSAAVQDLSRTAQELRRVMEGLH